MKKNGRKLAPVKIEGRTIASTFWGKAWCENLERYSDFANRLPRGRSYVNNGSVIDLQIAAGKITALVSGSDIYEVDIKIAGLARSAWKKIRQDCSQSFHSLIDLLQGRFSEGVMERLTQRTTGLFPEPKQIDIDCSCPDYAGLCKHAAAVLYGVGARLDSDPQMLFLLRKVDHAELISEALDATNLDAALGNDAASGLKDADLGAVFGIELDSSGADLATAAKRTRKRVAVKAPRSKRATSAASKLAKAPARSARSAKAKRPK